MSANGKYLLDTNIVIAHFAEDILVQEHLNQAEEIFIPCMVIGELYYGAEKSMKKKQNLKKIDEFSAINIVLGVNTETAKFYAAIKVKLYNKGRPIPENDIWISAIALQYQLTVVSRDEHFKEVDDLKFEVW